VRALRIEPGHVRVRLKVVAQQATRRLKVAVQLHASPQIHDRVRFEVRDQNEWLAEIEVAGDRSRVEALAPEDVLAFVSVSSAEALPTPEFRPFDVTIVLPEGVRLVSPPPTVHMRIRPREVVGP